MRSDYNLPPAVLCLLLVLEILAGVGAFAHVTYIILTFWLGWAN